MLDLSFNALSVDSLAIESFARYSSLEELYVSHNSLAQLPEQVRSLCPLPIAHICVISTADVLVGSSHYCPSC